MKYAAGPACPQLARKAAQDKRIKLRVERFSVNQYARRVFSLNWTFYDCRISAVFPSGLVCIFQVAADLHEMRTITPVKWRFLWLELKKPSRDLTMTVQSSYPNLSHFYPGPETPVSALSQDLRWNQLGPALSLEPSQKPQTGSELARSNLAKSNLKSNTKANSQLSLSKLMAGWGKVPFSIFTAQCSTSEFMVHPSDNLFSPFVFLIYMCFRLRIFRIVSVNV